MHVTSHPRVRATAFSGSPFPSAQARPGHPAGPPIAPHRRAVEMAEAMRELVFRDGHVTEAGLIGEGFATGEIIEFAEEARQLANLVMVVDGQSVDNLAGIIDKAIAASAGSMPITAGVPDTAAMRVAWRNYCTAVAAHKLDPWVSQSERCLVRLHTFLDLLPLLEREKNRVVQACAAAQRKRVLA